MSDLTFGGISLASLGAFFDGSRVFVKPEKEVEFVQVAGRNGDLSFSNNRYSNTEIVFNCFIRDDFAGRFAEIINSFSSLDGYQVLTYTTEPDIFREAQFVGGIEAETGSFNKFGQFELVFNCKPQKFYTNGNTFQTIETDASIYNPYNMIARPIFRVTGSGTLTLANASGSYSVTVSGISSTGKTDIDSEAMDCYWYGINRNSAVTFSNGFPFLHKGMTDVTITGFSEVQYKGRFWRL